MNRLVCSALACCFLLYPSLQGSEPEKGAARWPQFRGEGALGLATDEKKLPVQFGPDRNLLWKTQLPPGHSSPCIWENRIFLTAYDRDAKKLETIALDRTDGRILWRQVAPAEKIEKAHEAGSPAVGTPTSDGKRVYVYFGSYGLICYDFEGKEIWKKPLPMPLTFQGNGTSPILAGDLLLLHREFMPEPSLTAFNRQTGEIVWKKTYRLASHFGPNNGYSTPVIWHAPEGDEIIIHSPTKVTAHSLKDGAERWFLRLTSTACTTPVVGDGMLFVVGFFNGTEPGESDVMPTFDELLKRADKDGDGQISKEEMPADLSIFKRPETTGISGTALTLKFIFGGIDRNFNGKVDRQEWEAFVKSNSERRAKVQDGLVAIKSRGTGEITEQQVAWREKRSLPEVPSPLCYRGRLYLVRDGGVMSCLDAKTGKLMYRERLKAAGPYFASPVAGDGKIYVASRDGVVVVLAAGDKLDVLARVNLGESIAATPALVDGRVYVRTENHLYAFGE